MQILDQLRQRFVAALTVVLADYPHHVDEATALSQMVRPTTDPRHGDYQANCAMPLAKTIGKNPRDVAAGIVAALAISDLCEPAELAGPGFINLRMKNAYLGKKLGELLTHHSAGVSPDPEPKTIVIDYSSPNVAKPMHVGHIRSTVIGDSLAKILRCLGHRVITDNHLGDWGTQFGMVIYGFKHFGDESALADAPVAELSRLYKVVNRLIEYHQAVAGCSAAKDAVTQMERVVAESHKQAAAATDPKEKKHAAKAVVQNERKLASLVEQVEKLQSSIQGVADDPVLSKVASEHREIASAVLEETAKLHRGDKENLELWNRFLPYCKDEINRVYERLNITFDYTMGESFYHEMLAGVVTELRQSGLASDSEGAVCVFVQGFDAPMIVQKRDGAFLYATTDLATLAYRRDEFKPDEILYVVDTRQSDHFNKLFAVSKLLGFATTRLVHVNFGTVLGDDGKPFKTRSGSSVGLESLLNDAVSRAMSVVCDPERTSRVEPPLDDAEMKRIANAVGHGAIKYADLSHHRTSDYKFDLEKMVSLDGNTSAYIQYAYARVQGILNRGDTNEFEIAETNASIIVDHPAERALVLQLLRFGESLRQVRADYAPNFLVDYLYETAKAYAVFNDGCPVLKADTAESVASRLALVAATGKVLRSGLQLLGIEVVPRM